MQQSSSFRGGDDKPINTTTEHNSKHKPKMGPPRATLLYGPPGLLHGKSQYLGGKQGENNKIYCVPGHAKKVLVIDPNDDSMYTIGPSMDGEYKWLRAVRAPNGIIYGLPCHADSILRIDCWKDHVTTIPLPDIITSSFVPWKFHGGNISPLDGCLYLIPQSASYVVKLDPRTDEISLVGKELPGKYKWYGGLVGRDGAIYGIPQNADGVLRIDPSHPSIVTVHGDLGKGGHKWHGGAVAGNGTIVGIPANANSVLIIEPGEVPEITQIGNSDIIKTGRHRSDEKYKFLGAMVGKDGRVYCIPSGSERVLEVDAIRKTVRSIGPNVIDANLEIMHPNKWQNGFTAPDGAMYAIPLNAETILRVEVENRDDCKHGDIFGKEDDRVTVSTFGGPFKGMNKWEGGVTLMNGTTYCMPNDFKAVLKIEPFSSINNLQNNINEPFLDQRQCDTPNESVSCLDPSAVTSLELVTTPSSAPTHNFLSISTSTGIPTPYKLGIPTLRSATHRVRYSSTKGSQANAAGPKGKVTKKHNNVQLPDGVFRVPPELRKENKISFDTSIYNLRDAVIVLLKSTDSSLVGTWAECKEQRMANDIGNCSALPFILEEFVVPPLSLARTVSGGTCETAQQHLSDCVLSNLQFMSMFDALVMEVILPDLKKRIPKSCVTSGCGVTFYYQRPPTLRLQPGPSESFVKPHADNEYGHQDGELNYWLPLTDPSLTKTELWCESEPGYGDYHPIHCKYGEICVFFGSFCRHYVPPNKTSYTRISLDFRVGVEELGFDSTWIMLGTKDDHLRRKVVF